ncbi:predicted protein [Naegleria gruberi]|uniref:Predicted protein n=1 Tax=Naegleria gruberi TaxID=5762 RepID=D2V2I7_NAEGR|nr:uncharacterized protein NAEGRDRAFT_63013 [Naegleria gruberi]EFC49066.1 predicted protein [Naegleria gruberi]|eukprot:XP_002681810.1 predicted protein [Naegleria gruberi strain NEG-M]
MNFTYKQQPSPSAPSSSSATRVVMTVKEKFEKHKTETNALLQQAIKKTNECDFNNLKEIIVMGEMLFKKVEQMDVFDLSEYPELRQERKDLIKKLQEVISQFDRYPKSVENFKNNLNEFHTSCKSFIDLMELTENFDIPFLKKYELFNTLASVDHRLVSQQIHGYRQPLTLFKPISKDMKVDHDNIINLIGKLFSLAVHVATVYEPMKRELPTIIQHNQDAQKFISQIEQLINSGSHKFSIIGSSTYSNNETFSQTCQSLINSLEISHQLLSKYRDTRSTRDIHSRHVDNTSKNLKKLEFFNAIFSISPIFSNVCKDLKNPSIETLSNAIDQLNNCKPSIEKLTKLEQVKSQLGEPFDIEITKAISFHQYVSNQIITILSKLKDLETNTDPNIW